MVFISRRARLSCFVTSRKPTLLGLSPLGLQASPAPLEEIVVTGTLAPRTLEELPTAVTVFTQADLEARGQSHLEGLLAESPNVNAANGGGRARFFQMRGIGERGQFSEPLNPSVGLILDGVDLSGAGGAAQLFDIETVNLFRGPQPGRYGANALAGLMVLESVAPPAPGDPNTGTLTAEGGNLGTYGLAGAFGTRFSDRLGVRVAAFDRQSDGWMRNQTLGKNDTGNYDERGARVRLAYALAPAWDLDLSLSRLELDNGYDGFTFDNSRRSLADAPGQDALDSTLGSLRLTRADLPSGLRATLLIAGSEGHIDYGYDEDWTFEGFHPDGYSSEDRYRRDRQTTTAELRLQQLEGSRPWTLGLYQHQRTVDLLRDYTFAPGPFTSQFEQNGARFMESLARRWPAPGVLRGDCASSSVGTATTTALPCAFAPRKRSSAVAPPCFLTEATDGPPTSRSAEAIKLAASTPMAPSPTTYATFVAKDSGTGSLGFGRGVRRAPLREHSHCSGCSAKISRSAPPSFVCERTAAPNSSTSRATPPRGATTA